MSSSRHGPRLGVGKRELAQVTDLVRPVEGVEQDRPLVEGQTAEVLAVAQATLPTATFPVFSSAFLRSWYGLTPTASGSR